MKLKQLPLNISGLRRMLQSILRLNSLVWQKHRLLMLFMVFAYTFAAAMPFAASGSMALLLNELSAESDPRTSFLYLALFLFAQIGNNLLSILVAYGQRIWWLALESFFEPLILEKKAKIDIASHENPKENDLFQRVEENGLWRMQAFSDRQFYIWQQIISLIIASGALVTQGTWISILLLISVLPRYFTERTYGKEVWGIWDAEAETRRRFYDTKWHFDRVSSLIELKLFQNTGFFLNYIRDTLTRFYLQRRGAEKKKISKEIWSFLFSQVITALILCWLLIQAINGTLEIGTFTFLLSAIAGFEVAILNLFVSVGHQHQDGLFVEDVFRLLDIAPVLHQPDAGIALKSRMTPLIEFENVSFRYPNTEKYVLKNFSLTIRPGEKVAFVGINGAGKTTFVKLLCRFYDPTEGRILIDGTDIKDIDLHTWYRILGVLFQDYARYHLQVKDVIALGRTEKEKSFSLIKEAAHSSEADVFIEEWEKEYDQMLGREFAEGLEPSVGQWQKIALARTFYRDPRVFILDEPTASIDAEAEAKIFERLERLPDDRTVILISHRFSTVRHADQIVVIENGTLSEYGTHEALLGHGKTYARLFRLQAKGYE